jgi:hypothetical protein
MCEDSQAGRMRGSSYSIVCPSCFLALLLVVFPSGLRADEFSKVSHYSVRMFSFGLLTIDTRMGNIEIEGWDNPRLEIEAEKVVRAGSEAKAQRMYGRVKIVLLGQDKDVRLRTLYPPRRLWRPFRGESKLSVNFRIRMPFDANLRLKCVDGDVRIRGVVGNQMVRVGYGDVEINVPDIYRLRSLQARSFLGYVQSDLHAGGVDSAGFFRTLSFQNSHGDQNIYIRVRMGGVYIYRQD